MLPGNIGYVDLDRLTRPMLDEMFDAVKDTRGLILDMRGYPRGVRQATIAARFTNRESVEAAIFEDVLPPPPGDAGRRSTTVTFVQTFAGTDPTSAPFPKGRRGPTRPPPLYHPI